MAYVRHVICTALVTGKLSVISPTCWTGDRRNDWLSSLSVSERLWASARLSTAIARKTFSKMSVSNEVKEINIVTKYQLILWCLRGIDSYLGISGFDTYPGPIISNLEQIVVVVVVVVVVAVVVVVSLLRMCQTHKHIQSHIKHLN